MAKTMMQRTPEQRARRREQNRVAQAAYRERQHARGLWQVPSYVSLDSRPDMWSLSYAFQYAPRYYFDAALGCLRDRDGVYQQANSFTSPAKLLERKQSGQPPRRSK